MSLTHHPVLAGIRDQASEWPGRTAIRWLCNDYPYAALMSMIDARARDLQLKGVRAGNTVALQTQRGIDAVVDIGALWSIGSTVMVLASLGEPLLVDEVFLRARVVGVLKPDGKYRSTGLAGKSGAHQPGAPSLVFAGSGTSPFKCGRSLTREQLGYSVTNAELSFCLSGRTVLGIAAPGEESSILETWAVLASGGTVDLISDDEATNRTKLLRHIHESTVDLLHLSSSTIRLLGHHWDAAPASTGVRDVVLSATQQRTATIAATFPACRVHRPTDMVIPCESKAVAAPSSRPPCGQY